MPTNDSAPTSPPASAQRRWLLAMLLTVSSALRIGLALDGGQGWWPDEGRFEFARTAARKFAIGHVPGGLRVIFGSADHLAFKLLALPVAAGVNAGLPLAWAAIYLGLFSVGSIYLVWRIALLTSGDEATALWSALFAAASVSLFYYARQLFPYDAALFFCLLGLAAGLIHHPWRAGLWCSIGFLVYNGYWLMSGLSLLTGILLAAGDLKSFFRSALWGALGLLLPVGAVLAVGWMLQVDLIQSYVAFSRTVTLGDFSEGWTFPWEYFWKAEGLLLAVWALAWALGLSGLLRASRRYLWTWSLLLLAMYFGLGFACVVLRKFVLYGRTVRCLTPLFALVCGGCVAQLVRSWRLRPGVQIALAAGIVAIAAPNFHAALAQWYPEQFRAKAEQLMAARPADPQLRVVNAWFYHNPFLVVQVPLQGVIFARPHPMQYEPFLYENQPIALRRAYRARDMTMRVGRIAPEHGLPQLAAYAGHSGPVRLQLRLPEAWHMEPILTTGVQGQADGITLIRVDDSHYRIAFDHWGSGGPGSTLNLDAGRTHTFEISLGSLLPPDEGFYRTHPELTRLRRKLWVAVDGQTIFNLSTDFFPAQLGQADVGFNFAGMSALPVYDGAIEAIASLPVSAVPL